MSQHSHPVDVFVRCAYTFRFKVHLAWLLNSHIQNTGLPSAYLLTTVNWLSCCGGSPPFRVVKALVQLHNLTHPEKVFSAVNRHCQTDISCWEGSFPASYVLAQTSIKLSAAARNMHQASHLVRQMVKGHVRARFLLIFLRILRR